MKSLFPDFGGMGQRGRDREVAWQTRMQEEDGATATEIEALRKSIQAAYSDTPADPVLSRDHDDASLAESAPESACVD